MALDQQPTLLENQFGIGNALLIDETALFANMHEVQKLKHCAPCMPAKNALVF